MRVPAYFDVVFHLVHNQSIHDNIYECQIPSNVADKKQEKKEGQKLWV